MKKLRPYQKQCIDNVLQALRNKEDKVYLKVATAGGKTFIAVELINELLKIKPDLKAFFIVPKNILIKQTVESFNYKVGIYNAGAGIKELHHPITIASVQSLANAKELPEANLIIFDECHRVKKSHVDLYERFKALRPQCKLIGMTATDFDMKKDFWSRKVFDIGMRELTDQNFLAPIVTQESKAKVDLTGVAIQGGDYNLKQLGERFTEDKIKEQVGDLLIRSSERKHIIVMCTSIKHAEDVHALIDGSFILHSTLHKDEQKSQLDMWRLFGGYLISVLIASEGFDFEPTDCLALMRPTRSPTLYQQAVGRIARLSPNKKDGLFLDYGNVIENLGFVYDIRKSNKGEIRHKVCSSCETANLPKAKVCINCNEEFVRLCGECLEMVTYGHACVAKKKGDALKNTTNKAYEAPNPWKVVSHINKVLHKSKKGTECLRVDYFDGIFNKHVSEYYSFYSADFKMWVKTHTDVKEYKTPVEIAKMDIKLKAPKEILLVKDGKYWKIKSRRF